MTIKRAEYYGNGSTAIAVFDSLGHRFMVLSVNTECSYLLARNQFYAKEYSENLKWIPEILATGLFRVRDDIKSGFVELRVWEII